MNYFRAPGATVTYTARQTRDYISRKARISRGLYLTPTRRDRTPEGWRFWFASTRGPAKDRGNWKVETVRKPDADGGDGDGGDSGDSGDSGGAGLPDCPPPGTTLTYLWVGWHSLIFPPGPGVITSSGSGYMTRAIAEDIGSRYSGGEVNPGGSGSHGPFGFDEWGYFWDDGAVFLGETITLVTTDASASPSSLWDTWKPDDRNATPGFILIRVTGPDGFSVENAAGLSDPFCNDGSAPPPPPPGPGPVPPGYIEGAGPWAYVCTCPDYTGVEPAYQNSYAPSTKRDRSFILARPTSPCKHIASAAKAVGDQKSLVSWVRQFAKDSPGSEFTDSPSIEVDYDFWGRSIRDADFAFRKTKRAERKALGKQRAQVRAQRAARRLSDKLGRMNRWNEDGDRNRIDSSKNVGRFGEQLNLRTGIKNIRLQSEAAIHQENYQAEYSRYMRRPDVRARNAIGGILTGVGDSINDQADRVLGPAAPYVPVSASRSAPVTPRGTAATRSVGPTVNENPEAHGF